MRILVTGAHSMVGRCVLDQPCCDELIGCGRSAEPVGGHAYHQLDPADGGSLRRLLATVRPDWVIHTAALTNVDQCETDRELARRVNLDMVSDLVAACGAVDAGLVHLSTDYVFDGSGGPYGEEDEPNPLSYYGALKLESEGAVLGSGIKGLVLRTLWLYGHIPGARRNLVTWPLDALARGEEIALVDDQWGNPTCVHDLARALLALCRRDARGLYHVGGSDYMTRYELGLRLARFFGLDAGLVRAVGTRDMDQRAPRPLRSGLRTDALTRVLGRAPWGFVEGLEHMARGTEFRRTFPGLSRSPREAP